MLKKSSFYIISMTYIILTCRFRFYDINIIHGVKLKKPLFAAFAPPARLELATL